MAASEMRRVHPFVAQTARLCNRRGSRPEAADPRPAPIDEFVELNVRKYRESLSG